MKNGYREVKGTVKIKRIGGYSPTSLVGIAQ